MIPPLLFRCVGDSIGIISKALKGQLVVPDWCQFTQIMGQLFEESRPQDPDPVKGGKVNASLFSPADPP